MTVIFTDKKLPERQAHDTYITPLEFCRAAVKVFPLSFMPSRVLDPGAGTGHWGRAVKEYWPKTHITGVEIRDIAKPEWYDEWIVGDYRELEFENKFHLIIGNPPFKYLNDFVVKSFDLLVDHVRFYAQLGFLARLNILAGQRRYKNWWSTDPLYKVFVSTRRVNFVGMGTQQPRDMGFFTWMNGYNDESKVGWLDWDYYD